MQQKKIAIVNNLEDLETLFLDFWPNPQQWSSSAQELDEAIEKAGYTVKTKFFHSYKLPESREKLMIRSNYMWLYSSWGDIFPRLQNDYKRQNQQEVILGDDLAEQLLQQKPVIESEIDLCAKYIQNENPELKHIKTPKTLDKIHLIRGALYGYPPENIAFFIDNYKNDKILNEAIDYKQVLDKEFGIKFNLLRLTKEQGEKLVTELRIQKPKKTTFTKAKETVTKKEPQTDKHGNFDPTGYLRHLEEKGWDD